MRNDYTGVPHTCPKIDEVISFINSVDVEWDEEYHTKEELIQIMEDIRAANGALRDFGNEKAKEFDELEEDFELKERRVNELTCELEDRNSKIEKLEEELIDIKYD